MLSPEESAGSGAVETYSEAQKCAELFKKHADEIDGIVVTLPNFGEEASAASWTPSALSGLKVPVLVQATPDRADTMTIANRRDSFCGKMSCCNNMMQQREHRHLMHGAIEHSHSQSRENRGHQPAQGKQDP